jgi:nicotinate-nucleotide pyrophosphorylase (carboxylating)
MFNINENLTQARKRNVHDALMEDIGQCDFTAHLIDPNQTTHAQVVVRESAVLCGQDWFNDCVHALDAKAQITWHMLEGATLKTNDKVCDIQANTQALLSAERAALNFLQLLSGTATLTQQYVHSIKPSSCLVFDTRKTLPGLRQAQKYAVRVGGGHNQRLALWAGILIKENHIAAAGSIKAAWAQVQAQNAGVPIQIEVETLAQLEEALACGAQNVLLDNFDTQNMVQAVALNQGRAQLEVSGNVQLHTIAQMAATGVDRISIGRITKDVKAIDYSMRLLTD